MWTKSLSLESKVVIRWEVVPWDLHDSFRYIMMHIQLAKKTLPHLCKVFDFTHRELQFLFKLMSSSQISECFIATDENFINVSFVLCGLSKSFNGHSQIRKSQRRKIEGSSPRVFLLPLRSEFYFCPPNYIKENMKYWNTINGIHTSLLI